MRREEKCERAAVRTEERVMDRKRQTEAKLDQEKREGKRMEIGLYMGERSLTEKEKHKYDALSSVCLQDIQFLTPMLQ